MNVSTDIRFPNLGIELNNVGTGFHVFVLDIAYYAIVITLGMIAGYLIVAWMAKRTKQDPEMYLDLALWGIVISVVCARLYYVAFAWDEFKDHPLSILNLRTGGLAIYGGVLGAMVTTLIFCRVRKVSFQRVADTGVIGLLLGQVIGRWGNFFNREAFGTYTNNLFAMQIDLRNVSRDYTCSLEQLAARYANMPKAYENILEIRNHAVVIDGATYLQVHPTFLYESVWNLVLMIALIAYTKHKKFDGEIFLLYLAGYGVGRFWIEGLRTDQLFLWGTPIAVSQALAAIMVMIATYFIFYYRHQSKGNTSKKKRM